jgi:hypothetical protein
VTRNKNKSENERQWTFGWSFLGNSFDDCRTIVMTFGNFCAYPKQRHMSREREREGEGGRERERETNKPELSDDSKCVVSFSM